ncbi:MAG TPA: hypothetical protein VK051_06565 [Paenalcaligenes sp.]|nr:hypothetical protein [Paenalcaligenes sp.]
MTKTFLNKKFWIKKDARQKSESVTYRQWSYSALAALLTVSLAACGDDKSATKDSATATSHSSERTSSNTSPATDEGNKSSDTATDMNTVANATADADNAEVDLQPIADEYLAILSTDETKVALGNTLPGNIWLSIEGTFINSVGNDGYQAEINQLGGVQADQKDFSFAPADEHGRLADLRPGVNEHGPYALTIKTEAIDTNNRATGVQNHGLVIILPRDAQAGNSYTVKNINEATEEQAIAYVGLYKQPRPNNAQGVIDVLELKDNLTASWNIQMTGTDANADNETVYQGAVQGIPLSTQIEFVSDYVLDGQKEKLNSKASYKNETGFQYYQLLSANREHTLLFPYSFVLEPATHQLGDYHEGYISLSVNMLGTDDELTGELEVVDVGDYYEMRYDFESADQETQGSGVINHIPKDLFEYEYY